MARDGGAPQRLFPIFAPPETRAEKREQSRPKPVVEQPRSRAVRGTTSSDAAHPFFAKRQTKIAPVRQDATPVSETPPMAALPAPWPSGDMVHAGAAPLSDVVAYELPPGWRRREHRRPAPCAPCPFPYTTHSGYPRHVSMHEPLTAEAATEIRDGLGIEERANRGESIPGAIRRAYGGDLPPADALMWSERWRPLCAAHVLSNEEPAAYLRDWLSALRVTHAARKRQVRTRMPQRKRRRPRMYDDEMLDDFDSDEDAWFEQFRDEESRAAYAQRQQAEALSNCILLAGPSGSGKSAAVHACATELGYEVFELYPGWGRRSGKDISAAVTQLTRNHMVGESARLAAPKQSLILLDEVDVLFDDDAGFWPAVIELVGASQRPVVLTCADASLVPTGDLPLQRQLEFVPPPCDDAAVYLSLIALHEGCAFPRAAAAQLYLETRPAGAPFESTVGRSSGAEHPRTFAYPTECRTADDGRAPDLRAALARLQWECLCQSAFVPAPPQVPDAAAPSGIPPALAPLHMLRRAADTVSQCAVSQREACVCETLPPWSRAAVSPIPCDGGVRAPQIRDTLLALAAQASAGATGVAESIGMGVPPDALHPRRLLALASRIDAGRVSHARHSQRLLALLGVYPGEQLPRPASVIEYGPYVRLLLVIDELRLQMRVQQLQTSGSARATRNSARLLLDWGARGHDLGRYLPFGPDEIRAGRATTFPR